MPFIAPSDDDIFIIVYVFYRRFKKRFFLFFSGVIKIKVLTGLSCLGNAGPPPSLKLFHFVSDSAPHKCDFQALPPMLTNLGCGDLPLWLQNSLVPVESVKSRTVETFYLVWQLGLVLQLA